MLNFTEQKLRNSLQQLLKNLHPDANESIIVDVYMHMVAESETSAAYLSLAVLNTSYAQAGIAFHLKGSDWKINSGWAKGIDYDSMKKSLHKGDKKSANLYIVEKFETYGLSTFPEDLSKPDELLLDGCILQAATVPGGIAGLGYTEGIIAVHEVGHWFGLLHTYSFSGWNGREWVDECLADGDGLADTPVHTKNKGCKVKDSCPNQAGTDPIDDFMNLTSDPSAYAKFDAPEVAGDSSIFYERVGNEYSHN
ncbi:hypothetical protein QQS21_005822 [Conoideocrella luteorostrata]|uniref:Peptidase M43 pregnancy-associated plasma-A domain-containing protein n=1 Tax=Conoideocrella luteorostrata TaxID=1105319 RepID=A0AAJ0CNQ1_9HYPO|nr:hypothetical protein QQS21_005822 [Conoideocrella luteorostrata]